MNLRENGIIYKQNREVYQTADMVDTMVTGTMVYSLYKVSRNLYALAMAKPWSPLWTGFWSLMAFTQGKFLMSAYLNGVFLVDEMYICGENLDQLKVRTILDNSRYNLFTNFRLMFIDKNLKREYVFPISECKYDTNNKMDNTLTRLDLGGMKFFSHKARTVYTNDELMKAVLHPDVHRIETLN